MHPQKLKNILGMTSKERYEYFIREVVKMEKVWGISTSEGWIMFTDSENETIFPIWPHKEVAEISVFDEFKKYKDWKVEEITLDKFRDYCIPDMKEEKVLFGIFYNENREGIAVTPQKLSIDINDEIEKYK